MVADLQPPLDCKKIALLGLRPTYDYVLRILAQSFGLLCSCKSGSYRSVGQFFYKTYCLDGRDRAKALGLLQKKKVLVIASQGGNYQSGTPDATLNHLEPYLRAVFGFMGITDMSFIYAHSLQKNPEAREEGVAGARESIQGAIGSLVTFLGARKSKQGRIRSQGKTKNSRE